MRIRACGYLAACVLTSVYIHFPWCLQKCPYCDFATQPISRGNILHDDYANAVIRELHERAKTLGDRELFSIFFGGGTPSLWSAASIGAIIREIRLVFGCKSENIEITVECNPSSFDREKAKALRDVGVNRVSIGVQSLDSARLRFLGRLHDADGALRAIDDALLELARVSGDLIFGNPEQTASMFEEEARLLKSRGLKHVSAYSLTIEPNTQFGALHKKGKLPIAKEDDVAESFVRTHELFDTLGLRHYEISNYAEPGEESTHNLHYWRGGDYLGLGAAAVGCLAMPDGTARRWRNDPNPAAYMNATTIREMESTEEVLSPNDRVNEALMLGLRTTFGVDCENILVRTGIDIRKARAKAIEKHVLRGNLAFSGDALLVPWSKWLQLDSIVADLF